MYEEKQVGVVIPAYNEEKLIGRVIETMPDFMDAVVVVDDCSQDRTAEIVAAYAAQDARIRLISHTENQRAADTSLRTNNC